MMKENFKEGWKTKHFRKQMNAIELRGAIAGQLESVSHNVYTATFWLFLGQCVGLGKQAESRHEGNSDLSIVMKEQVKV